MRRTIALIACIGLLTALTVTAADPPYVGRWKVNEDKSDFGSVITFSRNASGELRFTQGDVTYVMHLDGSESPHPLGGVVSWRQLDDRTWTTRLRKDGKVIGEATFAVSVDGKTLTTAPADGQGSAPAYAITTRTVSDDGRTLIEVGGFVGKPPSSRLVWERQ